MVACDHTHTSPRLRLAAWLLAATLLAIAFALAPPAARAGTASDMTTALAGADGATGWLVKRGGTSSATTLAAKNDTFVFEPASSITFRTTSPRS